MTELRVASIPKLILLQKACESLVIINTTLRLNEKNVQRCDELLAETNEANEMVEHIRGLIRENLVEN